MSIFCCPSCQKPLCREERRLVCPAGHSFDVARSGYVNLLLSQQTGRKHHGDDKRMVKARSAFLERGYYDPMRQELIKQGLAAARQGMTVLDAGCGEGYYTAEMAKTLREREYRPKVAGIDISKAALQEAAKRDRETEYAVASCFHLPVAGESVDLLLSVFAPYCGEEFLRVLKPDGTFFCSTYGREHMKEISQLVKEFDSRIVLSEVNLYDVFGLENGREILNRHFDQVEEILYEDHLEVRDEGPLMEYILSCHGNQQEYLSERYDEFREFLKKKIEKKGTLFVTKRAGIFRCKKKMNGRKMPEKNERKN